MAKMKFYLNIEGAKLRTLDDLRENFFADGVLAHYQSGKLAQWLDVWNYKDELEQVQAIQAVDTKGILSELCRIFDVEADLDDFADGVPLEDYLAGKKAELLEKELEREKEAEHQRRLEEENEAEFLRKAEEEKREAERLRKDEEERQELERRRKAEEERRAVALREEMEARERERQRELERQREIARRRADERIRDCGGVNSKDSKGRTPLVLAIYNDDADVVRALLESGADVNARGKDGWTVLMDALNNNNPNLDTIKVLIEAGVDVNAKDKKGDTALMMVKSAEVANLLANAGANVNARDKDGWPVLIKAVLMKVRIAEVAKAEVAKALIRAGADVNAKDNEGKTVLQLAVQSGVEPDVIAVLINAGADVNASTSFMTILDMAMNEKVKAMIKAAGGRSHWD